MSRAPQTHLRRELALGSTQLERYRLTLVAAPGGYGKTSLVARWRERLAKRDRSMAWLTLSGLHEDPTIFLEDLLDALRRGLGAAAPRDRRFGESIDRLLSERVELRPERVARELSRELDRLDEAPIVCLDAFEHLRKESAGFRVIDQLLRLDSCPVHLVLTTRGLRPDAATLLLVGGQAREITASDLNLRTKQIGAVLRDEGVEPDEALLTSLVARTRGWAMAVRLAARALAGVPHVEREGFVREMGAQEDLIGYIGAELLGRVSAEDLSLVETAALMGRCTRSTLLAAAELEGGEDAIDEAIHAGLLMVDGDTLTLHDLLRDRLSGRVRRRSDGEAWRRQHERIGIILQQAGESEQAVLHYLEARPLEGVDDRIVALLCEQGDLWFAKGHRRVVREAIDALAPSVRRREPTLIALDGLLLSSSDPDQAITHLKAAAEAYRRAGNRRAELMSLYEIAVVAHNENRPQETLDVYRRAVSLRSVVQDRATRALVTIALAGGAFMAGRHALSMRFVELALTYDHSSRERALLGVLQAWIFFHQGQWTEATRRIEAYLSFPGQREYALGYHAVQVVLASIDAGRGVEGGRVRDRLEAARDAFDRAPYSLNRIRVEQGLAFCCRSEGDAVGAARHLECAAAIGQKIALPEAEASSLGSLARVLQRQGRLDSARDAADRALRLLDRPAAWTRRWGNSFFWAAGITMACCVLAELGEHERVQAFLRRHIRRLRHRALALCDHGVLICLARIRDRAGDASGSERALREALSVARQGGIEGFAPELDAEVMEWAEGHARTLDVPAATAPRGPRRVASPGVASPEPAALVLRSLGGLGVERRGRRVADRSWRGSVSRRLLMRLLTAEGRPLPRERIEADLWPDAEPESAHNSLSVALHRLRGVLEPKAGRPASEALLDIDAGRIGLTQAALEAWDVTDLRDTLARAESATSAGDEARAVRAARAALALADADFLPESYDDWVLDFRRSLDTAVIESSTRLAAIWLEQGGLEATRCLARLSLARLPSHEPTWDLLVRAELATGDHSMARRTLEEAWERIRRELDAAPGPKLQALAQEIADSASADYSIRA